MRDLRDPKLLGETLLELHKAARWRHLSQTYDNHWLISLVPDYSANPGPLEKYGDPRKLPSTLPN